MGVGELHGVSSADNTNDLETEWATDKTGGNNCKKKGAFADFTPDSMRGQRIHDLMPLRFTVC
jgi:hypothetical protein